MSGRREKHGNAHAWLVLRDVVLGFDTCSESVGHRVQQLLTVISGEGVAEGGDALATLSFGRRLVAGFGDELLEKGPHRLNRRKVG